MTDFKRILLATDFSECSRGAEQSALSLARSLGAAVLILHVVELPAGLDPGAFVRPDPEGPTRPLREYVTAADSAALHELAATFRAAGVAVTDAVEVGPIAPTLVQRARSAQVDLVVVGSHGRTGLRRAVLGSIAEQLIRQSPVPVLVVRRDAEDSIPDADEQARVEAEG